MKALSFWQPWASLIADGRKRIETRSWRPPGFLLGHWLAIHAAKKLDRDAAYGFGYDVTIPLGAIVAVAFLESWICFNEENTEYISDDEKLCGDFTEGRFGWQFCEVRKYKEPIPVIGHQGLFEVQLEIPR